MLGLSSTSRVLLSGLIALSCLSAAQMQPVQEKPIRFGRTPALSPDGSSVCFSYQGNLWIAPSDGGSGTRITANDCLDINPKWSADGKWIAFNSNREGGTQVFVVPADGGPAKQLTYGSYTTTLYDWFPDGRSVLVGSTRYTRYPSLYKLDVASGKMKLVLSDFSKCLFGSVSPDGKQIAFTRGALADTIRKGYHGAANYDIYVAPVDGSKAAKQITKDERNDMWPVWAQDNKTIYFSGEEDGNDNASVWKTTTDGMKPVKVVASPPNAIRYLSSSPAGSLIAYECDNWIYTLPMQGGPARKLEIFCRTDERGPKAVHATISSSGVSQFALSPDAKRTVAVIRGDLFLINNEKPLDAKRLTDSPTQDADPNWAPDGRSIVYSSSRTGTYKLYVQDLATKKDKQITSGEGYDNAAKFSPDGKWIAYLHGEKTSLRLVKPDGTGEQIVCPGPKVYEFSWSPDSKWLAYTQENDIRVQDIWAVKIDDSGKPGKPINVTDHPGFNDTARWFPDGSKLLFRSNRYRNRDIETINDQGRYAPYTVSLEKEKEKLAEDDWDKLPETPKPDEKKPEEKKPEEKKLEIKIDPDEIERRAKQLVGVEEGIGALSISPDSKTVAFVLESLGSYDIYQINPDGKGLLRLTSSNEAFLGPNNTSPPDLLWSPDSSKIYYLGRGGVIKFVPRGGGPVGVVAFTAKMDIERLEDYYAIFDESNQILTDGFYDKTFRGKNWKAVGDHYRKQIADVSVRTDFDYLMSQWLAELNSSHTGFFAPGGRAARPSSFLGVVEDQDYDGPGVKIESVMPRSPAALAESLLKPGEYILQVDGQDVSLGIDYDQALLDKAGKIVTLLVNDKPVKDGAHIVKIRPVNIGDWQGLKYEKWIDERRAIVDQVSNGKVGYLHVADMGDDTRNRFERELLSIGERKDAMILDFRGNNGGDTHDSLLNMLERKVYFNFAPRTETPFQQPEHAYTKPIIVLMDEFALSDAEVFANGFKELKLGKIVGNRTMGWIVFTNNQPVVDGSILRRPYIGCYTLSGQDMDLWGVPPDVLVINTAADFKAGKDEQLERAVEEVLKDPRPRHG